MKVKGAKKFLCFRNIPWSPFRGSVTVNVYFPSGAFALTKLTPASKIVRFGFFLYAVAATTLRVAKFNLNLFVRLETSSRDESRAYR